MARLIAARRTAVVPRHGDFARLSLEDLAAPVLHACLADAGIEAAQVDEVILANALGAGGNPARRVSLAAGLPETVAGLSTDRQCAGGLDAILLAKALVDSTSSSPGGSKAFPAAPCAFGPTLREVRPSPTTRPPSPPGPTVTLT